MDVINFIEYTCEKNTHFNSICNRIRVRRFDIFPKLTKFLHLANVSQLSKYDNIYIIQWNEHQLFKRVKNETICRRLWHYGVPVRDI